MVTLEENKIVRIMNLFELHLLEMRQTRKSEKQCFAIFSKSMEKEIDFLTFKFRVSFNVIASKMPPGKFPIQAQVTISSQANSYGIGWQGWFDGIIENPINVQRMAYGYQFVDTFNIFEVNETWGIPLRTPNFFEIHQMIKFH